MAPVCVVFLWLTLSPLLSLSIIMSVLQMRKQIHENITYLGGTGAKFRPRHFDSGMLTPNPYRRRTRALDVQECFYDEVAIVSSSKG